MCGYYKTPDLIKNDIEYSLNLACFRKKTMDRYLNQILDCNMNNIFFISKLSVISF